MNEIKELSSMQRECLTGEPVCVMCGKYAEYVCAVTEMDVCSMECKTNNLLGMNRLCAKSPAATVEEFLSGQLLKNIDFKPSKAFLDVLPSALYGRDLAIIGPELEIREKCLVVPLIHRLQRTCKV